MEKEIQKYETKDWSEGCSSYKLGVFQLEEKKENPGYTDHDNESEVCGGEKTKVVSIRNKYFCQHIPHWTKLIWTSFQFWSLRFKEE